MLVVALWSLPLLAVEKSPNVVGGSDAVISDAPWQAFVRIGNSYCGGVVIASTWVLTAAHCLDTAGDNEDFSLAAASSVTVYTGTAETFGAGFSNFLSSVDAVYANSAYNKSTLENDIGLLKLSSNVHANASAVQLPNNAVQLAVDATADSAAKDLLLTGWGFIDANRTTGTNTLQKATLSTISDASCATSWGSTVNAISDYQSKFFCAQETGKGACNGDSGGPLIWYDPSRAGDADGGATLVGLVSFGVSYQCASDAYPDVYTQVSNYLNWISGCQAGSCPTLTTTTTAPSTASSGGGGGSVTLFLFVFAFLSHVVRRRYAV
ncbi:serine endopeptidase [Enterovibrio nigricans]|nr:serine endopeptidase [Enterovibrio nigricans]